MANTDEMEASADVIDIVLSAYLKTHPQAQASKVTALQLIAWVRKTAADLVKKDSN